MFREGGGGEEGRRGEGGLVGGGGERGSRRCVCPRRGRSSRDLDKRKQNAPV